MSLTNDSNISGRRCNLSQCHTSQSRRKTQKIRKSVTGPQATVSISLVSGESSQRYEMPPRTGRAHSPLVMLLPALGWFAPTHVESFSFFCHGSTADNIALRMASSCSQRSEPQRFPGVSILGRRSRVMSLAAGSSVASGGRGKSGDGSRSAWTRGMSSETATEQVGVTTNQDNLAVLLHPSLVGSQSRVASH